VVHTPLVSGIIKGSFFYFPKIIGEMMGRNVDGFGETGEITFGF